MNLRVLTFNIQHCRSFLQGDPEVIDFGLFADTIRCFDPDIVGLNEVRGAGESHAYTEQAKTLAELLGYHYFFAPAFYVPNHGLYGNAILSKFPLEQTENIPIPDPTERTGHAHYETRCVAKANIKGLTVLVTHFGLNPDEAQNAVDTVCKQIDVSACPVILMGDFNVRPDNAVLLPIRDRMEDTEDVFRTSGLMSYPSDKPYEKIDYIFTSKEIKTTFATLPQMLVSDHRPLFATVEIAD